MYAAELEPNSGAKNKVKLRHQVRQVTPLKSPLEKKGGTNLEKNLKEVGGGISGTKSPR